MSHSFNVLWPIREEPGRKRRKEMEIVAHVDYERH